MAGDDLNSITGMEDKHRRALARRQITTLRDLADADEDVIYRAMGSIKPRPSHNQIAQWQADARSKLVEEQREDAARSGDEAQREDEARGQPAGAQGQPAGAQGQPAAAQAQPAGARGRPGEGAADTTEWQEVASFVVAFARRRVGETWERRIEAERTEVEPAPEREVWPGWECSALCSWMLGQTDGGKPGEPEQDDGGEAQRAGAQPASTQPPGTPPAVTQPAGEPAGAAKPRGGLPQLRIDSATITDAAGGFATGRAGGAGLGGLHGQRGTARHGGAGGGAAPRSRRAGPQRGGSGDRSGLGPGRVRPVPGRGLPA